MKKKIQFFINFNPVNETSFFQYWNSHADISDYDLIPHRDLKMIKEIKNIPRAAGYM